MPNNQQYDSAAAWRREQGERAVTRNQGEKNMSKSYLIRSVAGEPDWDLIPLLHVDQILWKPDCGVRAYGQFCRDSESLCVHLCAIEADIRAEYTAPLSPVCRDSCLEFFFMPVKETRYFNFEINPNGCLWIGFGHSREDSTVLYRSGMEQLFDIRTGRTRDGSTNARRKRRKPPRRSAPMRSRQGGRQREPSSSILMFSRRCSAGGR
jgi:hypothetical protein